MTGLYRLTKEQKAAVFAYLRLLQEKYWDKIEQVVLFGSVARGEYDEESDVDIMTPSVLPPVTNT